MTERAEQADRARRRAVGGGVLTAAATVVALWPYTGVIQPGMWTFVCVTVVLVVAAAGVIGRLLFSRLSDGARDVLTLALQVAAAIVACTTMLVRSTALFGLVPTADSVRLVGLRIRQSVEAIVTGTAPLEASLALATVLGLAFAVVAILVDHLVAHRVPVMTILLTTMVGATPMLVSFGAINLIWFLLHAVLVLLLLRAAARGDRRAPKESLFLLASATGVVAIVLTLVAAPVLPVSTAMYGTGPTLTVSPNLRLGDDLRRPQPVQALSLVTSAATPPYLRIATLSRFDGDVWRPDRLDRVPLDEGFGARPWSEEITTVEHEVSIRVLGVSSERLPVPYAAEEVTGVDDGWSAVPDNRTVTSRTEDAIGADYTVQMASPAPTLEQIRASDASRPLRDPLPDDLPAIIGELAEEVTADAETDYDRMLALQDWFRSEFSYSLDTPVEEGFDGTGADAVAAFLEQRTGYCVHFAGAFALMARSLDIPVRIVVGYLPGTATDEKRGDDIVYAVDSDQLHSWPEVYFTGIGWVPFEPTATLGVPTEFVAAEAGGGASGDPNAPEVTATPSAESSAPGRDPDDPRFNETGGGDSLQTLNPTPVMLVVLGVIVLVLLPAAIREVGRAIRMSRARRGDPTAAWQELADTMTDLGLWVPDAQTARVRAAGLTRDRGVEEEAVGRIVDALERERYAGDVGRSGDLAMPLRVSLAQLAKSVDPQRRLMARLLPASLFTRR